LSDRLITQPPPPAPRIGARQPNRRKTCSSAWFPRWPPSESPRSCCTRIQLFARTARSPPATRATLHSGVTWVCGSPALRAFPFNPPPSPRSPRPLRPSPGAKNVRPAPFPIPILAFFSSPSLPWITDHTMINHLHEKNSLQKIRAKVMSQTMWCRPLWFSGCGFF